MYIDYLTSAKDYNALWVKSLNDLSQIHSEGYQSLGKHHVEVFEIAVKAGSDQLKAVSRAKDFKVFATAQSRVDGHNRAGSAGSRRQGAGSIA